MLLLSVTLSTLSVNGDYITMNDDYIATTIENGYLPCARAWSNQCGIAIVRAQINLNTAAYHNLHIFNSQHSKINYLHIRPILVYIYCIAVSQVALNSSTVACKLPCHNWQNILNS